jgi:hypothetical protein
LCPHDVVFPGVGERSPQLRHEDLYDVEAVHRLLVPQRVDQTLRRDGVPGLERQHGQQASDLVSGERNQLAVRADQLDGSEQADLHGRTVVPRQKPAAWTGCAGRFSDSEAQRKPPNAW